MPWFQSVLCTGFQTEPIQNWDHASRMFRFDVVHVLITRHCVPANRWIFKEFRQVFKVLDVMNPVNPFSVLAVGFVQDFKVFDLWIEFLIIAENEIFTLYFVKKFERNCIYLKSAKKSQTGLHSVSKIVCWNSFRKRIGWTIAKYPTNRGIE